ncbi:MAG: response regulator [Caulobacteraceae bacterium]
MCHVLIIEDEAVVAMGISMLLESAGASTVAFAETESEAVEAVRRRRPAVITSDVNLRAGTGPKAIAAIHAEHGHIPVIYITASPEQCVGCPPEHVFAKPIDEARVEALFRVMQPH